ncbi:MAG: MMPL family transporter [Planctomycetes bacterium]|nr:MMPL family transporter [Planctomycetota bacterium]
MDFKERITSYSTEHYKRVTWIMVIATVLLGAFMPLMRVDTDPENMLSEHEAVRVFHDRTKQEFVLNDLVVLGIINEADPNGVFNVASLTRIYELTEFARRLQWDDPEDPNRQVGVIEVDLMAPSLVDHISQGEPGTIRFEWLMPKAPVTEAEALAVRDKALSNPLLAGSIVSEDGKALCLYLPLTSKDISYEIYKRLFEKIDEFKGPEHYHITGLPVAEDTFGYEMFIQMAVSAPLAMAVIFLLMLFFFRKLVLVISPMIVAMVSVICTMGLLIAFGFPVHIMSSMIPIFLMPIAVVDSVHILSEFFDLYTKEKGRKQTTIEVMSDLFMPMLYTSLTSAAGFLSLALTPIPPVQVFGIFVAVGIMIAWLCTILFVPAYIMMIKESALQNFGASAVHEKKENRLGDLLKRLGQGTYLKARFVLGVLLVVCAVAAFGITRIKINDNPIKWFSENHPIRKADIALNDHFAGTYMAYLVFEDGSGAAVDPNALGRLRADLLAKAESLKSDYAEVDVMALVADIEKALFDTANKDIAKIDFFKSLAKYALDKEATAPQGQADVWYDLMEFFEQKQIQLDTFKNPERLEYLADLQRFLVEEKLVGKSNSMADIVKKVYQELMGGEPEYDRIPETASAVSQCLIQFQSSHTPDDLWHFVTGDFKTANVWLQLRSGDNRDMERVVQAVDDYVEAHPTDLAINWAGLTYINIVWQQKMVWGMLQSLMGSFIIVFIMMTVLFRSPLWGLLCMVPLTITIAVIYGVIGLVGKDYDMPVAVLSALTLGMAVDFAIHFLERARAVQAQTGSWKTAIPVMFGEPARAITRNVLVIAIGFLPLLAATLIPYRTVGVLLFAIMALSGSVTLIVLTALVTVFQDVLFRPSRKPETVGCNCSLCMVVSTSLVVLVGLTIHQIWHVGITVTAIGAMVAVVVLSITCALMSRRQACRRS